MKEIRRAFKLWPMLIVLAAACWSSACSSGIAGVESSSTRRETERAEAARAAEAARTAEREGKRAQLRTEMSDLESERSILASRLDTATKSADNCRLQSESYAHAIEEQEIATKAFMMNHKAVVIAIGAGVGGAVVVNDPQLSKEQQELGGIAAAIAVLYGLAHLDEVAQVGDALMQADSHLKDLRAASERADQERQKAEAEMKDVQSNIAGLNEKLGELRASLAAL